MSRHKDNNVHVEDVSASSPELQPQSSADGQLEEVAVHSVGMAAAMKKEKPNPYSKNMIKLYLILLVSYMCSMTNGFDANTFGGIMAMDDFKDYFDSRGGSTQGLLASIYVIGNMIGSLFAPPAADKFGRRFGIGVGSSIAIISVVVQASAQNTNSLMAGRFILGLGVSLIQTAGPAYCVEMAHPAYRGTLTGLYQTCFFVGTCVTTWMEFGLNFVSGSSIVWRLPLAFQAVPSIFILCFIAFIPDTPRWYMAQGREEEAHRVLTKYHGDGNPNSLIVQLELQEMRAVIELDGTDKRWWDVRDLFRNRAARYRIFLVSCTALFGAWNLPPTSYYLPLMVKTAGVESVTIQLLLNAVQTPIMFISAFIGSTYLIERIGRRKLFIVSSTGQTISIAIVTACSAMQQGHPAIGRTGIAFLFIFLVAFSCGWTPLQAVYPTEVSTFSSRAKTLAANNLLMNAANFLNTYLPPVAIEAVGWKFYLFYVCWDLFGILVIYLFFVETRGRNLEEIDEIFNSKHPVKTSLQRRRVVINQQGDVVKGSSEEDI